MGGRGAFNELDTIIDIAEGNFTLGIDDGKVLAIVGVPFNFTVPFQNVERTNKPGGVSRRYTFLNNSMFVCRYSGYPMVSPDLIGGASWFLARHTDGTTGG